MNDLQRQAKILVEQTQARVNRLHVELQVAQRDLAKAEKNLENAIKFDKKSWLAGSP